MNNSQFKKVIVIAILVIVGIVTVAAIVYLPRIGKVRLEVQAVPAQSTITLNDKPFHTGVYYLEPGVYTLKASYVGYDDDIETVNLKKDSETVALLPTPGSDDAKKFIEEHPDIQSQREALGGFNANKQGSELQAAYPVITKLPYIDPDESLYAIDYGVTYTAPTHFFITISNSSPEGRANAITWLKKQGVNIATTDIRYGDYENPLLQEESP